jgi:hypothetical protein
VFDSVEIVSALLTVPAGWVLVEVFDSVVIDKALSIVSAGCTPTDVFANAESPVKF